MLLAKFVKVSPAVRTPCLLSMPTAPTSSSSACVVVAAAPVHVVAVVPELGVMLFPMAVWQRSLGDGDTMPLNEKRVAAAFTDDGKLTVIEPVKALAS